MSDVIYPNIKVQLSGEDGNAFMIIGRVRKAMERAGVGTADLEKFSKEAMSGDYDHVLQTCMRYVDVS